MRIIDEKFDQLLRSGLSLGAKLEEDVNPDGGNKHVYEFGAIYFHQRIGAPFECHGLILETYLSMGEQNSGLGYPVSDEEDDPSVPFGRLNRFEAGVLAFDPSIGVTPSFDDGPIVVPRVVVKIEDAIPVAVDSGALLSLDEVAAMVGLSFDDLLLAAVRALAPEVALRKVFDELSGVDIQDLIATARANDSDYTPPSFDNFLVVDCPDGIDTEALAAAFEGLSGVVEYAYPEAQPSDPLVVATGNPFFVGQGYLGSGPTGIGVQAAWAKGADGSDTRFVDLERGWFLDHEDLPKPIHLLDGINLRASFAHGTGVLGITVAVDNNKGVVGIAPQATAHIMSYFDPAGPLGTPRSYALIARRILASTASLRFGDVLQIEINIDGQVDGRTRVVPVETEPAIFEAIRLVTKVGIIVVEAGGNGDSNLDNFRDRKGRRVLARNVPLEFRDSGAIMVGACTSALDPVTRQHGKWRTSNFGSRIDCCAWGENIITTGNLTHPRQPDAYFTGPFFSDTSGSTPIITGVCLLIQHLQTLLQPRPGQLGKLGAATMRSILRKPQNGTPVTAPVGPMPDMARIITNEYVNP